MPSFAAASDASPRSRRPAPAPTGEAIRADMIVWAEPVVADRIAEAYAAHGLGAATRSLLTIHHRRLWRALLLDRRSHVEAVRRDLLGDAMRAGVGPDHVDAVDHDVLEELMDIVLKRFRASPDTAKGHGLVLLAMASTLGLGRAPAA